jgi:hypothetical protein
MSILERLHSRADSFARQLSCNGYSTALAEQDFRNYLESDICSSDDYPFWGARASWHVYRENQKAQSGSGNPLSPLLIFASEFSADDCDYQELYFKQCYDLMWKDVFGIPCPHYPLNQVKKAFKERWGGAAATDMGAGYFQAPFYQCIRHRLKDDELLWDDTPFVSRLMAWHTGRDGGHQWCKASTFIQALQNWPAFAEEGSCLSAKNKAKDYIKNTVDHLKNDTCDDYAFFSECSLNAARVGVSNTTPGGENEFLEYALDSFRQPRIFLINPAASKGSREGGDGGLQGHFRKKIRPNCQPIFERKYKSHNLPLSFWHHTSGSLIVFSHKNLTGPSGVSYNELADICYLIRKAARRL